ncbi:hypothetical protein CLOSTASPAR_01657 [[Clostridium] asparagiforme DSM 15981]|uniref:Uncharacterized protein n=1 Tax=[Clostridium] asparagiforme DSM 15981 TaxID=518636 RepID=C0CXD5_9FIRM|nr:hypothetical protein CLOSTASPAR_01657 [[Clostridium] asparagiforme DSM 15981]
MRVNDFHSHSLLFLRRHPAARFFLCRKRAFTPGRLRPGAKAHI